MRCLQSLSINQPESYFGGVIAPYLQKICLIDIAEIDKVWPSNPNIEKARLRLLELTDTYLKTTVEAATDPIKLKKNEALENLKILLTVSPDSSAITSILKFSVEVNKIDSNLMKTHRTADWKRYLANVFSVLTLIPALILTAISYSQYGSFRFWQPESQRVVEACQSETDNLNKMLLT